MKKKHLIAALIAVFTFHLTARADEGMWLLSLIGQKYEDMKKKGLQLTPEQIYSVNSSSLKDAVVNFGGFCTGEIISKNGLLLTNHHCGYDKIQSHSTPEKNYLKNGFWAKAMKDELPNPGLTVTFLIRMEDVTDQVGNLKDEEQQTKIGELEKKAVEGTHYTAEIKDFFEGNKFYLFVYEVFSDVRLVGAPPSSIGKFGGDTDNWMWPRHTGDFSIFRVYAGPDGKPAEYSEKNVPLTPRHHLPVSLSGVRESDFAMVMGYPGSTERYQPSEGVRLAFEQTNPARIKLRENRLAVMKAEMNKSEAIELMYSPKYYQISNYYKYFIGQNLGIKNLDVISQKKAQEKEFLKWAAADPAKKAEYSDVFSKYDEVYKEYRKVNLPYVYLEEGIFGIDLISFAYQFAPIYAASKAGIPSDKLGTVTEELITKTREHFKEYYLPIDKKLFSTLLKIYYQDIDKKFHAPVFQEIEKKYKGNFEKYADNVYKKSFLTDSAKTIAFLKKPDVKLLEKDPGFSTMLSILSYFRESIGSELRAVYNSLDEVDKVYVKGILQKSDTLLYPDANFTQRLTYGKVGGYWAKDATYYKYYTTLEGIIQKEDTSNAEEFTVEPKLKELYKSKDFGRYANEKGELPVCFITNNDITGGNSGSPCINAKGQLIGTAFDGNWEAMSGDIEFSPELQRCIVTDIRYVLFVIDKYADARRLIDEMTIVKEDRPAEAEGRAQK
jgi:hypothetical protein